MSSPLLKLSDDLLLCIADYLEEDTDLDAFCRTNWRTAHFLTDYLYKRNIKHSGSSALLWAAEQGVHAVVHRMLRLGADINTTSSEVWEASDERKIDAQPYNMDDDAWDVPVDREKYEAVSTTTETDGLKTRRYCTGYTPLMLASKYGHVEIVRLLLSADNESVKRVIQGRRAARLDPIRGRSALSFAAEYGLVEVAKILIAAGADLDCKSPQGWTPLSIACQNKEWNMVRKLLTYKDVFLNGDSLGRFAPIFYAAMDGEEDVVKLLIARGADLEPLCSGESLYKRTPLYAAVCKGHLGVVDILLATKKVDLNRNAGTEIGLIERAAAKGHMPMFKRLLDEFGEKISSQQLTVALGLAAANCKGNTATGHEVIVKLLLDMATEPAQFAQHSESPLLLAARHGDLETFGLLLQAGVDPRDNVRAGSCVLAALIRNARRGPSTSWILCLATILLEKGVKADTEDSNGKTPLHHAVAAESVELIELLIRVGKVDLQHDLIGTSCLYYAVEKGSTEMVHLLLSTYKVKPDYVTGNYWQETPLTLAARTGKTHLVKMLLQTEAVDPFRQNCCGKSAVDYAEGNRGSRERNPEICALLQTYQDKQRETQGDKV